MDTTLMTEERSRSEYTWYGRLFMRLAVDRNIRNPTDIYRRVDAMGGYPRQLSPQTVINYFRGLHNVPFEFHQYGVVMLDAARALTEEERDELEDAYAWGQRHLEEAEITPENIERAREFVREMRARHGDSGGAS